MNKTLILGATSFIARGLYPFLTQKGYNTDLFNRGEESKTKDIVYGDIHSLSENKYLKHDYNSVINCIIVKNSSIEENIKYIKSVIDFCVTHNVKQLIHFSSLKVYRCHEKFANEETAIEPLKETCKKGISEIKIAVDEYLLSVKKDYPFEIIFIRPGYVIGESRPYPFIKHLPLNIKLIKGSKKSRLPMVNRTGINEALVKILAEKDNLGVYHIFTNNGMTKFRYAKKNVKNTLILTMPEFIFKFIPFVLTKLRTMPVHIYSRIENMYNKTLFSADKTEDKLKLKFEV